MNFDVIIIGNGIIPYTTAYSLIQKAPELKIAIVGPKNRQGSGSVAAGAMLNVFAEVTNQTFSSNAGKKKFEMALQASKLWPEWVNTLNDQLPSELKFSIKEGTFVLLNARSGKLDSENYNAILKALKFYNEPYENVSDKDIPGLNPFEDSRPLSSIFLPNEGAVSSAKIFEAFEFIFASKNNITFIDDTATRIMQVNGKAESVETTGHGTLHAPHILLANGVYAQPLIDSLPEISDRIPRLLSGMGCSLIFKQNTASPIKHVLRTPNRSGACGLHVLPRGRQAENIYIGATNNVFFEPQTTLTTGLLYFLLQCVIEQIDQNLYSTPFVGWHIGNRPATIDTFPLIGETSIGGLWILTGTYRDGFHQSPLLADHISNQILGLPGKIEPLFSPERPLIQTMTVEQSIDEYILHYMAATYEHGSTPPKFVLEKGYRSAVRHKTEKLYENLGTSYGMSPDMVFMFDFDPNLEQRIAYFKEYFAKTKTQFSAKPTEYPG